MWLVEKIEISGGFLPGLNVNIPRGLTCIIGPRGSGKSTLAEALRFAICGTVLTSFRRTLRVGLSWRSQPKLKVRVDTQLREASSSNPFF